MDILEVYEKMVTIRRFEETVERLFLEGRIMGTAHTCIGQEAVAVGAAFALTSADAMTTTHRGHGHLIARGGEPSRMMAELFGKDTGYSHGYGGSQMMMVPKIGFYGANGITAGSMAFAAGIALEAQMHNRKRAVLCILGDGASNQGMFHEALNISSLWRLPVVFLVENNGYAMSTPVSDGLANVRIADRASSYGIPGRRVNGNDYFIVNEAVKSAMEDARFGRGPTLLECVTYRLTGHSKGDPRVYRTREEENAAKKNDPILMMENRIRFDHAATDGQMEMIRKKAEETIWQAVAFAENSPTSNAMRFADRLFA